jgi:phosphohistidine phosphatase
VQILVVRHGDAIDGNLASTDAVRHLTAEGRDTTRAVGAKIRERVTVTAIYTSPLVRAVQTAELLAAAVGFAGMIAANDALVPGGSIGRAVSVLDDHADDAVVMFVSHEPTVRALSGHLSGLGDAFPGFRTSGVALIERDPKKLIARLDPGTLRWTT